MKVKLSKPLFKTGNNELRFAIFSAQFYEPETLGCMVSGLRVGFGRILPPAVKAGYRFKQLLWLSKEQAEALYNEVEQSVLTNTDWDFKKNKIEKLKPREEAIRDLIVNREAMERNGFKI